MSEQIIGEWLDPTVGKTIEQPEVIFSHRTEFIYYRQAFSKSGSRYYKVVIRKNHESNDFYIVTAFPARKMQERGVLIWQKD